METIIEDYLKPNISQIRHSILGIDDSYNNVWDVYAELTQNSVDAIRKRGSGKGRINLEVDCPSKSVTIADDGVGIAPSELPELLKPFGTNKTKDDAMIGEKGVGLKFVIFSSNSFYIKSGNDAGVSEALIRDAYTWKKSTENKPLPLATNLLNESFQGTIVEIQGIDNETIFDLSFEQFVYTLQTRTALGCTKKIWEEDVDIEIILKYTDVNGGIHESNLEFRYWLPTDQVPPNSKINLIDFENWLEQGDRTDQEKVTKLKDKIIFKKGEFVHSNQRRLRYFACFVPQRRVWNEISINMGLASEENLTDDNWLAEHSFCTVSNGIYVSVKGMPTGISIDHPTTGYAGYWANIFILFEDPFLRFDIGRKSIHGRQASIHREYAKQIFKDFLAYVTKYVTGDINFDSTEWDRDEIFSDIEGLVDLGIENINFIKSPAEQEASVAALFFILIGSGRIDEITPLISGYRNRYDLYALWGKKKIIIEFKARLRNLARDFNDARKMFDEMNCVVCWEVTDKDKQVMRDMGVNVEEISPSIFAGEKKIIPHSTHVMNLSGFINPIYVIDLKVLLSR
jgi:hypothetical protein